jgi:hypothetical protein
MRAEGAHRFRTGRPQPWLRHALERAYVSACSPQTAAFSKTWMPHAEPNPMTWARPTLAPSI